MKSKKLNLKAIVLSLGLAAMMLPANASAQETAERPGGLFGSRNIFEEIGGWFIDEGELRDGEGEEGGYALFNQQFGSNTNGGYDLHNQTFGQDSDAPLGSGLLILAAAGAGYALRKKKNNKKH